MSSEPKRLAWARLNADAALIATFALAFGISDVVDPASNATVHALGFASPSHYLRSVVFIVAGLLILAALARAHIAIEVIGRMLLIGDLVAQAWRTALLLGWGSGAAMERYAILGTVVLFTWMRLSALLSKHGLTVQIPPRTNRDSS